MNIRDIAARIDIVGQMTVFASAVHSYMCTPVIVGVFTLPSTVGEDGTLNFLDGELLGNELPRLPAANLNINSILSKLFC